MGELNRREMCLKAMDTRTCLPIFMDEALRAGRLTMGEYRGIQQSLIRLVQRQGDLWSGGESGSLPMDMGERLLASILYVMGLELKYYDGQTGLTMLKRESVVEIFDRGLERIGRRTRICRHRWQYLKSRLFETSNRFYTDTVRRGLGGFFKLYAPVIDALELHITADYTPCLGRPEEGGIEFIESYLSRLEVENAFCRCFDPERADGLLKNVSSEYSEDMVNLFEQLLLGALGCVLAGENPRKLIVSAEGCEELEGRLRAMPMKEGEALVEEGWKRLQGVLGLPEKVRKYGDLCLPVVGERMVRGAENGALGKVIGRGRQS